MTCGERYYPPWSSRGIRAVICERPAKFEVRRTPYASDDWTPACGIHARRYSESRPLCRRPRTPGRGATMSALRDLDITCGNPEQRYIEDALLIGLARAVTYAQEQGSEDDLSDEVVG